jgi:hypothetical protein
MPKRMIRRTKCYFPSLGDVARTGQSSNQLLVDFLAFSILLGDTIILGGALPELK